MGIYEFNVKIKDEDNNKICNVCYDDVDGGNKV